MKHFLHLLLCACGILIVSQPRLCLAAEAGAASAPTTAAPDFQAMINTLFDQAATCEISGSHQEYRRHWIDFTTTSTGSLQQLRQIFLQEQPRYLGTELPESLELSNPFGIDFVWKDTQGRQLGHLKIPREGDMLVLNDAHLFATSATGAKIPNKRLLMNAAAFACPEFIAERKLPKPDYKAAVEALFAGAVSCKIDGSFSYKAGPAHEVKFSTSDAGKLRKLKSLFLSESPRFVVSLKDPDAGHGSTSNLYFEFHDAQGKWVGRIALLAGDTVYFTPSHDIYATTPLEWGRGASNVTLFNLLGRFSLPDIYPTPESEPNRAAQEDSGKNKR